MTTAVSTRRNNSNASTHAATDAAVSFAHNLIDRIAKGVETPEEKIRAVGVIAEAKLKKSLDGARHQRDSLGGIIQQNPLAAIGIALGVGVILARWRRRESAD